MAYYVYYQDEILFDPYGNDYEIITNAKLTFNLNSATYFDFDINYTHPLYSKIAERRGLVSLYWEEDLLFEGEILSTSIDFQGIKTVSCVDPLNYLNNTIVRPYSTLKGEADLQAPSSFDGYFKWLIDQHNEHMKSSYKQFKIGVNQAAALDENNYIYRASSSLPTTLEEISEKIIENNGGILEVEYLGSKDYRLNFYSDIHSMNSQIIDFGVNITGFSRNDSLEEQYTAIRIVGADVFASTADYLSIKHYYAASSSNTSKPSSWSTSIPRTTSSKKYLWTYDELTLRDSKVINNEPVVIFEYNNDYITSIRHYYHADYYSSIEEDEVSWSTTLPTTNTLHKYLWCKQVINYNDSESTETAAEILFEDTKSLTLSDIVDGVSEYNNDFVIDGDIIYSKTAVDMCGYSEGVITNEDIYDQDYLHQYAVVSLLACIAANISIDVNAIDLSLYMDGYTHLKVGEAVRIRSKLHNTDEYLMVSGIELDLNDPTATRYTLGASYDTLTGQQSDYLKKLNSSINKNIDTVSSLSQDVKDAAKDLDATMTALDSAVNRITASEESFAEFKMAVDSSIEDLHDLIDGSITTWFYAYAPTASNYPSSEWDTVELCDEHLGDLFYDTTTGYVYRWMVSNDVYSWSRISDTDVTKALADAAEAKDTADSKRRIFYQQPTIPYDAGDLWVQGENGNILVSVVDQTTSFTQSDWVMASKYENTINSSEQLWFAVSSGDEAPAKPTSRVTETGTSSDMWTLSVPARPVPEESSNEEQASTNSGNGSLRLLTANSETEEETTQSNDAYRYYYCYQQQRGDGTWQWTDVVYDSAVNEAKQDMASAEARIATTEENASESSNLFTDTIANITEDITNTENAIAAVRSDLAEEIKTVRAYIEFKEDNGTPILVLGSAENPFRVQISNTEISFMQDSESIAYISNSQLYIPNAEIETKLSIGDFTWIPRSNGNLSLKWIGA